MVQVKQPPSVNCVITFKCKVCVLKSLKKSYSIWLRHTIQHTLVIFAVPLCAAILEAMDSRKDARGSELAEALLGWPSRLETQLSKAE